MLDKFFDDSYEFKPLLAEIEESPVSPLGRTIFWIIVLTILFFSVWLIFGKVDIVVSARGKVIPDGEIKVLQPLDTGVIGKILVKEGDFVKKGQILMEIDPSTTRPELESVQKNLNQVELEKLRLNASSNSLPFVIVPPGMDAESVNTQKEAYSSSNSGLQKQLGSKYAELRKIDQQIKGTLEDASHHKILLATSMQKEQRLKPVIDLIAKDDYEKVKDDISTYSSNIEEAKDKLGELNHQKEGINEDISYLKENFKYENLKELADRQKQSTQLQSQLRQLSFKSKKQQIKAPVNGYVVSVLIHTVGGVVTPAEKIISIVPANSPLTIKATVINRDIGFIKAGMPAAIKIDTFDFQKYGILKGKVNIISRNSIDDPKNGPVYEIYITPINKYLLVEGKRRSISSGMSLTAEIKVGKRRIIEFFIYPLIKYLDEGISVR